MLKKHYADLTKDEERKIRNRILLLRSHKLTKHAEERLIQKGIDLNKINKMFSNYQIIEFHKKDNDNVRVLLRSTIPATLENICISMDLYDGRIITCYKNSYEDKHYTLRLEEYSKDIDVILEIKEYILRNSNKNNKTNTYKNKRNQYSRNQYSRNN